MKSKFAPTVIVLAIVSFLTDISSEMVYPLIPIFLTQTLHANIVTLGIIEGFAEATSSLLKVFSGSLTDRFKKRKPFILLGYSLAALARPIIAIASSWKLVFLVRFLDRIGKGIRTAPRDALIADVTNVENRASAFGFHRSMDHAGAVLGPILASVFLGYFFINIRTVFLLSLVPGLISIIILGFKLNESSDVLNKSVLKDKFKFSDLKLFDHNFKFILLVVFIFTLGNSTDAFLLMRLSQAGITAKWIGVLWSLHHVVKMIATYWGGRLADRYGNKTLITWGWLYYALIYCLFAINLNPSNLILVFMFYGVYYGLTEPAEKALIARLAPPHLRGTAYGFYQMVVGLSALPASLLFGLIWHQFGANYAFLSGSGLAASASLLLYFKSSKT